MGEVALQPSTGGTFVVTIDHDASAASGSAPESASGTVTKVLWDRKVDGGFPETKELKRRVRDVIEPDRNLGHVDKDYGADKKDAGAGAGAAVASGTSQPQPTASQNNTDETTATQTGQDCEDCK